MLISLDPHAVIPPRSHRDDLQIQMDATTVPVRGDTLGKIWWRGRQWAVTTDGIELLDGTYFIAACRLTENVDSYGWPAHICEKTWVDTEDFCTAWLVALTMHGAAVAPDLVRAALARSHPPRPA